MSDAGMRKALSRVVLAVAALAVAIAIGEVLLTQVFEIHPPHHPQRYIRLRERPPLRSFEWEASETFLRKVDGIERHQFRLDNDEDGNVLPAFESEKPEGTILFLGGSTTECENVGESNRFPFLVGQLLAEKGIPVNTINSASIGNHSRHSLNILLNKGLKYEPDIAVMMHNINDLTTLRIEGSYFTDHPTRSLILTEKTGVLFHTKGFLRSTIPGLYQSTKNVLGFLVGEQDEFKNRRRQNFAVDKMSIQSQFRKSVLMFIGICHANDIEPVLMTQASRFKASPDPIVENLWGPNGAQEAGYRSFTDIFHALNEDIRQLCRDYDVLCIDLAKAIPPERTHLYDSVHFNDTGSKQAASVITAKLEALILSQQ